MIKRNRIEYFTANVSTIGRARISSFVKHHMLSSKLVSVKEFNKKRRTLIDSLKADKDVQMYAAAVIDTEGLINKVVIKNNPKHERHNS